MNDNNFSDFDLDDLDDLGDFEYSGDTCIFAPAVAVADDLSQFSGYDTNCAVAVPVDEDSAHERKRKASAASCASVELYKMPRPRILKRDFRRVFPMMWASVFNSCDYDYMLQHLYTYYDPEIALVQRDLRAPSIYCPKAIPGSQMDARGITSLAQFWFASMNIAPDLVCTLKHTCLKVRTDGTSTIQCCFTLSGTKIIALPDSSDVEAHEKLAAYQAALEKANNRATISQTAAAVAAVAPHKVAALLRTGHSQESVASTSSGASPSVSLEDSLQDFDDTLSLSDVSILDRYTDVSLNAASQDSTDAELSRSSSSNSGGRSSINATTRFSSRGHVGGEHVTLETNVWQREAYASIFTDESSPMYMKHQKKQVGKSVAAAPVPQTKAAAAGKRRKRAKGVQDWQSLGEEAYKAGSIGSSSSTSSVSSDSRPGGTVLQSAASLFSRDASPSPVLTPSGQQVVLTGALDCVCSFEMQLNADHKVVSMVLNYIT